jgi:hypothetical protein
MVGVDTGGRVLVAVGGGLVAVGGGGLVAVGGTAVFVAATVGPTWATAIVAVGPGCGWAQAANRAPHDTTRNQIELTIHPL